MLGPPGLTQRLQEWQQKFHIGSDAMEKHIIIDVDHWPSFGSRGILFPTQITHSTVMLFDVDGSFRFATPREHLQAMGFKVDLRPDDEPHAVQKLAADIKLTAGNIKYLAGNGMHLHIFGSWMAYVLGNLGSVAVA